MVVHPLNQGDPGVISGYVLQGRLGTGGMGTVYLSTTRGGQPVAIKTVRPDLAMDPRFRQRFEQEVKAARRVRGRYIANVLDSNTEGPMPWLATEYVPGVSLAQAISNHGTLPLRTCLGVAAGVASALETIHTARVIHRDLKPGNIVLTQTSLSVIDFGIARALDSDSLTGANTRIGTPAFMAPEQIKGNAPTTSAADVFSLGLTVHVAMTGLHPFEKELFAAIPYLQDDAPDLTACPEPLRPLIGRCLAMNPADRPTATEVVAACREVGTRLGLTEVLPEAGWLPGQFTEVSVSTPPPSPIPPGNFTVPPPPEPAARNSRKRIAVGSTIIAAAVVAALTVWIAPWNGNSDDDKGNRASDSRPSAGATASDSPGEPPEESPTDSSTEKPPGTKEDEMNLKERVDQGLRDCESAKSLYQIDGANATLSCKPRYGPGTVISEFQANQIAVTVASFTWGSDEYQSFLESEEKEVEDDGARGEQKADPSKLPLLDVNDFPYRGPVQNKEGTNIGEVFTHANVWKTSTITWTFTNDYYVDSHDEYFVITAKSKDREALMKWWNDWPI
ncbi:serine/threonine-protein kinase [Streptomyces castrisilvae]|uniref:Serine/threonine-protein kinase n=1 Tax=Streptomyces castrisilvae TaxID=3033811 RepID=A0ABY9HIX6_9ACTN|nr:serine/threonine-protein kinase [Streptomyces sp. Mut1]WLQ34344.1 serine/threonine-protein kinase [Streptomyces sp. Mut1]